MHKVLNINLFSFSFCVSCLNGSGFDARVQHCTKNNIIIVILKVKIQNFYIEQQK